MSVITSIFLRTRYGFVWKLGRKCTFLANSEFKNSYFQNEAKCKIFFVKINFICMRKKNRFHINSSAFSLALKERLKAVLVYLVRKYQLRTWRRDCHFYVIFQATRRSSRLQSKGSIFFHCYFKTLSIGAVPRTELATSRSTGQRFTDWANPAVALLAF